MDDYSKIVAKGNLESDDWENIDEFFETVNEYRLAKWRFNQSKQLEYNETRKVIE